MLAKKRIIFYFSSPLYLARILLMVSAVGILLASFLFPHPSYDPTSIGLNPQLSQTLVYGGIAVFLALYSWWWPVFGGVITGLYGCYKLFGFLGNILSGHNPFDRNLFTMIPAPAYYALYSVFVIGAILSIIAGLKTKTTYLEETDISGKLRIISLIMTLSSLIMAVLYAFGLFIYITYGSPTNPHGSVVGSMLYLVPLILILTYIAWKWSAQGGLLEILFMVPLLVVILASNWELLYLIPLAFFSSIVIIAAVLNIARGFLIRRQLKDVII
jgi:hypothetical protein